MYRSAPVDLQLFLERCVSVLGYGAQDVQAVTEIRRAVEEGAEFGVDRQDLCECFLHLDLPEDGRSRTLLQYIQVRERRTSDERAFPAGSAVLRVCVCVCAGSGGRGAAGGGGRSLPEAGVCRGRVSLAVTEQVWECADAAGFPNEKPHPRLRPRHTPTC